jgi:hypothetical protein
MSYEAEELREEAKQLALIRIILVNFEVSARNAGYRALASQCDLLESELGNIEESISSIADLLDPPKERMTGKQMIMRWKETY